MNRLQLAAMVFAALCVMALLIVSAGRERATRMMLYLMATALLAGGGVLVLVALPWYSEHWGYFNPISGFYFLLLAVAPLWAALNLMRGAK